LQEVKSHALGGLGPNAREAAQSVDELC
jgi:hypothetical protein